MNKATITKSIRLSPEESTDLEQLSEQSALSESMLMKKWIQEGIQKTKLDLALQAYQQRRVDLRTGAAMAGLSYHQFMREVEAHNIVLLDEEGFLERLAALADAFQNENLGRVVRKMIEEQRAV
jgi:predicted DNA-binding protein